MNCITSLNNFDKKISSIVNGKSKHCQGSNHYFDRQHLDDESKCSNEVEYFNLFYNKKASSSRKENIQNQDDWQPHCNHRDFNIKIDILNFEGHQQFDKFVAWLHTIEQIFKLNEVFANQRIKLITTRLKKYASI